MVDAQANAETAKIPIETNQTGKPEAHKPVVSPEARQMAEKIAKGLGDGNPDEIAQSLAKGDESPLRGTIVGARVRPDGTFDASHAMSHFDTQNLAKASDSEERIAAENDHIRSNRYKELPPAVPGTVDAVGRNLQQTIDVNRKIIEDPKTLPKMRESAQRNLDALHAQREVLDEIIDNEMVRRLRETGIKGSLIDIDQNDEIGYRQAESLPASEAIDKAYTIIDKLNERFPDDPAMAAKQKFKINQAESLALKLSDESQRKTTQGIEPEKPKADEQPKETPKTASENINLLDITSAEDGISDAHEVWGHAQLIEEYGPEKMQEIDEKIANGTATEEEMNNYNYIYNIDRKAYGETYGEFYDRMKEELAANLQTASENNSGGGLNLQTPEEFDNEFSGAAEQSPRESKPTEQPAPPKPAETTPKPVETAAPKEDLEKLAEELSRQTRERGFGVLRGFTAPVDHIPVGYYDGRGFAMGQQIEPDLASGNLLTEFVDPKEVNRVDQDILNPHATNGRQTWTSSSFESMTHWTKEEVVKKGLFKKEVVKTQHEAYNTFTSLNGQKMHGEKDWISYSYRMPVISNRDTRAGSFTEFNFVVPPDIASKIDTAISKDPAFADIFYQATFPGITGSDERNYIRRARATELAIVNRRDNKSNQTIEIKPYSKPIEY